MKKILCLIILLLFILYNKCFFFGCISRTSNITKIPQVEPYINGCGKNIIYKHDGDFFFKLSYIFHKIINFILFLIEPKFKIDCDYHDLCYHICGTSKNYCDDIFYDNMLDTCVKSYLFTRHMCITKAFLFYAATNLTTFACDSYITNQKFSCMPK